MIGRLLVFKDRELERVYVRQYIRGTSRRVGLLALALLWYSVWTLMLESDDFEPRVDPALAQWDLQVLVAYNLAWLTLALAAVLVLLLVALPALLGRVFGVCSAGWVPMEVRSGV